ncbi:MAG: transketolase [Deltaproteobacteria bacterium]|nr:transketolase [Deltaproteobacteria bacterium]MBT7890230.1 transketolase [Deltaproteobacteria bacterium]
MSSKQQYSDLSELDQLCINTIRFLSADAIQTANSGHPGLPMGMAGIVFRLFTQYLKFNPENPQWHNRDRFVLSAGHGSALLYTLLHLTGYDLSLDDLKDFRKLGSKTPGHPEYGHTPGVEATTGPLGQGIANAVGLAIAGKYLGSYLNRPEYTVMDYHTYVLSGDGCLQEGIASEACSLAGHLGLNNLIVIYDDNKITIDGKTDLSFSEDVAKRFEAYNWHVQEISGDGHDLEAFDRALVNAQEEDSRPSLIKVETVIGYGSPNKQGTSGVHGSPLGADELKLTKEALGWNFDSFHVPDEARAVFDQSSLKGKKAEADWNQMFQTYETAYPELAETFQNAVQGTLPQNWTEHLPKFEAGESIATRVASGKFLENVMPHFPLVLGGSADLTPSNNTKFSEATVFQKDRPDGRYIHFGVREHAMGAILNGISLSGLLRAYGATFLCFADYMLPAIRVAALSKYPSIFVFTHDSIGLGEDGPTHQPVEHVSYLRAMPELILFRPADANETVEAWKFALEHRDCPVALALTRQGLPVLDQTKYGSAKQVAQGGYTLISDEGAQVLLIASGSEVSLAVQAHEKLAAEGIKSQVVSMPSCELFDEQPEAYRKQVLPEHIKARVVIEAGIKRGWEGYMGDQGQFVGMSGFGASAPAKDLFKQFEITVEAVMEAVRKTL